MKRHLWLILAALALLGMFFVPRAAYSIEIAVPVAPELPVLPVSAIPMVPAVPILPAVPALPALPALPEIAMPQIPAVPAFPSVPVPAAEPRSGVRLPARGVPGPVLPFPVLVSGKLLAAEPGARPSLAARLDKVYDNAPAMKTRASDDDAVIVPESKRKRKNSSLRLTLPESDLESEIGGIR